MKTPHDLACAISALINSKPRSPTVAELEAVIGEQPAKLIDFTPATDDPVTIRLSEDQRRIWLGGYHVSRIDPACFRDVLGNVPGSYKPKWGGPPPEEIEGLHATIFYLDPLVLIALPDEHCVRTINGNLIKPNQLYVRWYDDECDMVHLMPILDWGMARVLAPEKYDALMKAHREWRWPEDATAAKSEAV